MKGTTITALRNRNYVTRTISFYKRMPKNDNIGDIGDSIEHDLNEDGFVDRQQNMQENELQLRFS